jgi:hypothetical protein
MLRLRKILWRSDDDIKVESVSFEKRFFQKCQNKGLPVAFGETFILVFLRKPHLARSTSSFGGRIPHALAEIFSGGRSHVFIKISLSEIFL